MAPASESKHLFISRITTWLERDHGLPISKRSSASRIAPLRHDTAVYTYHEDPTTTTESFSHIRSSVDIYREKAARTTPQSSSWPHRLCFRHRRHDIAVPTVTTRTIDWLCAPTIDLSADNPPPYSARGARPLPSSSQLQPVKLCVEGRPVYHVPILITHSAKAPPEYSGAVSRDDKQMLAFPAISDVLAIPACRRGACGGVSCGIGWKEFRDLIEDVLGRHVGGLERSLDARCEVRMVRVGSEGLEERVLMGDMGLRELGRVLRGCEGERATTVCLRVDWWFT